MTTPSAANTSAASIANGQPATAHCPEWLALARQAARRVPPVWPLQHFVAVNPFVGLANQSFLDTCDLFRRLAPGGILMHPSYYNELWHQSHIVGDDLTSALRLAARTLPASWAVRAAQLTPADLTNFLDQQTGASPDAPAVLTVADTLDRFLHTRWVPLVTEEISKFCAAYHDQGQSLWPFPWKNLPLFPAWRRAAALDATPEISGLTQFRAFAATLPDSPAQAIARCLRILGLNSAAPGAVDFLHRQFLTIPGWSSHIARIVRDNSTDTSEDNSLIHLLAIRLAYDAALLLQHDGPALREFWTGALPAASAIDPDINPEDTLLLHYLWHSALEQSHQRGLIAKLQSASAKNAPSAAPDRPAFQAVFCIDVRSEIYRRSLETAAPRCATIGFAGFFGLPVATLPLGQSEAIPQCPVLLSPAYTVQESTTANEEKTLARLQLTSHIRSAWKSFKDSAVSSFSFVETAGLVFAPRLGFDAFLPGPTPAEKALRSPRRIPRPTCQPASGGASLGIPEADQASLALGILRNMGLTKNFAPLVLLCGHGSSTANNPYAAGLDCGACGGHPGDINARLAATLLNTPAVRATLAAQDIHIPADTWFLAGLHNTTTDQVTLLDLATIPATHSQHIQDLQTSLDRAADLARATRAPSLGLSHLQTSPQQLHTAILARSRDWAQTRPEWGLAGNAAFIAAPRRRTRGLDLAGRAFLHDYNADADPARSTLELIMCAPMVVANWINLQYYASTVNNDIFGSGDKTLHNVVGVFGIQSGNGGDLRVGLPLQSIHDGARYLHQPLRLTVLIEAPREDMDAILTKHESVRHLVENGWLHLIAISDNGATHHRRLPDGTWEKFA